MLCNRRGFLGTSGAAAAGVLAAPAMGREAPPALLKPPRLRRGDCVALINPVRNGPDPGDVEAATRSLQALGLRTTCADSLRDPARARAVDEERAREINAAFADPEVKGLLPLRGGYGCAHLLPHLDYAAIRARPKILMGFSDLTSLLVGIHIRAGLVTFHGPMGVTAWPRFTVEQMERVLFRAEAAHLSGPEDERNGVRTLVPGCARGRLLGTSPSSLRS